LGEKLPVPKCTGFFCQLLDIAQWRFSGRCRGVATFVKRPLHRGDAIARCDQAAAAIDPEKQSLSVCRRVPGGEPLPADYPIFWE
jgi:hypothetical protein